MSGSAQTAVDVGGMGEEGQLSVAEVHRVLGNARRRYVLQYLKQTEEGASLGGLAEFVAAQENEKSEEQVTSAERKCAYIALYQSHLPKMDKQGIIEYSQDRGGVSRGAQAEVFDRFLEIETGESEGEASLGMARLRVLVMGAGVVSCGGAVIAALWSGVGLIGVPVIVGVLLMVVSGYRVEAGLEG